MNRIYLVFWGCFVLTLQTYAQSNASINEQKLYERQLCRPIRVAMEVADEGGSFIIWVRFHLSFDGKKIDSVAVSPEAEGVLIKLIQNVKAIDVDWEKLLNRQPLPPYTIIYQPLLVTGDSSDFGPPIFSKAQVNMFTEQIASKNDGPPANYILMKPIEVTYGRSRHSRKK